MKAIYGIVGIRFRGGEVQRLVAQLKRSEPIKLIHDPGNPVDPNAVQVWARGVHIGYVPAAQAAKLARRCPIEGILTWSGDRRPLVEVNEGNPQQEERL